MAGNIGGPLCTHCGWQRHPHEVKGASGEDLVKKGYKRSLSTCPGFKPRYPWLHEKLVVLLPDCFFKKIDERLATHV